MVRTHGGLLLSLYSSPDIPFLASENGVANPAKQHRQSKIAHSVTTDW